MKSLQLVTASLFLGLSGYIALVMAETPGAEKNDLYAIALLVGAYGVIRLYRALQHPRDKE